MKTNTYHRLPKATTSNELYAAAKQLNGIQSRLQAGNDFDPKEFDRLIETLQEIRNQATEHEVGTFQNEA